jgi:hypothetical protein
MVDLQKDARVRAKLILFVAYSNPIMSFHCQIGGPSRSIKMTPGIAGNVGAII